MTDKIDAKSYDMVIYYAILSKRESSNFSPMKENWKYKIFNPNMSTQHSYMTVLFNEYVNKETGVVTNSIGIIGSLRKWYFGELSLEDFTERTYYKALNLFAQTIGISTEELYSFTLSMIEVGINCRLDVDVNVIKKDVYQFRDSRYRPRLDEFSIYFKTKKKILSLKIYDKYQEIYDKCIPKRIKSHEEEEFVRMHQHKNNIRIEFSVRGGQDLINKNIFHLTKGTKITIGTTVEHFDTLYTFFWNEVQKIKILSIENLKEPQSDSGVECKNYLLACRIRDIGINEFTRLAKKVSDRSFKKRLLQRISPYIDETEAYDKKRFMQNIRCRLYCLIGNDRKISKHKELVHEHPLSNKL